LEKLLAYDPEERISAENAIRHEYFAEYHTQMEKEVSTNTSMRSTFFSTKQYHNNAYSLDKNEEPEK